MAVIRRYLATNYPGTILGTYSTLQAAMNALPNPRDNPEIIEVEASQGNTETITGFNYNSKSFSEHLLIIRPAEDHQITIESSGAEAQITMETWSTGNDDWGNMIIQDFILAGNSTGDNAVRISGAKSGGSGSDVSEVTFLNISGEMINNNRIYLENCANITFVNCNLKNAGNVIYFNSAYNDINTLDIFFYNCLFQMLEEGTGDVIRAHGSRLGNVEFHGCTIENGQESGVDLFFSHSAVFNKCIIRDNANMGICVRGRASSMRSEKLIVKNCLIYDNPGRMIHVDKHFDNVEIYGNTLIYHPTSVAGFGGIDLVELSDNVKIMGNIISSHYQTDFASLRNFLRLHFQSGTTIQNLVLNYNLYFRHDIEDQDLNIRIAEIVVMGSSNNGYNNIADLQEDDYELNSLEDDPLFLNEEYSGAIWYRTLAGSPARNLILQHNLLQEDIRGYDRQEDENQDAGAWDHMATSGEEPEPQPDEFKIFLGSIQINKIYFGTTEITDPDKIIVPQ